MCAYHCDTRPPTLLIQMGIIVSLQAIEGQLKLNID